LEIKKPGHGRALEAQANLMAVDGAEVLERRQVVLRPAPLEGRLLYAAAYMRSMAGVKATVSDASRNYPVAM
jgi:hypothetical protein